MLKSVLLVEDNADDIELTLRAFRKHNLAGDVNVVQDGAEALDYLFCTGDYADRDPSHQPAVILLDLNLPKIGGLEVLKRIRKHKTTRLLPVVVLTTSKEDRDLIQAYSSGANSYIQKPVDYQEFLNALKCLGTYWLNLNEVPSRIPVNGKN